MLWPHCGARVAIAITPCATTAKDESNIVSPLNGTMFLAKLGSDAVVIPLHTICVPAWAEANHCETLMPLKKRPTNNARILERNVA
jgi:hypothetical protein